ncbi:MAG TPA: polysaccharide biosynthesis tyrosine autokinase [Solirubrobacteraceae bacterium]
MSVVRRRAPWVVLCFALVAVAAYGYAKHRPKKYTATAAVAFTSNQLDQQIAGLSTSNNGLTALAQQQSNLELLKVGEVAAKTASQLGHGLTEEKVSASLSISAKGESSVFTIAVSSPSPVLAAAIANTYAGQFVKDRQGANRQFFKSALALVKRQLAALSPGQRFGSDGLDLEDRAHTLALLAELGYNNVEVAQEASVPSSPSSPRVGKDTAIGAILGLLFGIVLAFLLEHFDRRIRGSEELEGIYRLPMLGTLPKSTALGGKGAALPSTEAEAFSLIRAHLRFFNVDRELRTILIASPAPGDGKTTISRYLAEAAARSGSRVLLLELDLRQPTLAQQLAIEPGPGLADVLIGASRLDQATQSVALQAPSGEGAVGNAVDVLTAGAVLPPNPGELLESHAMDGVLERAKSGYDLVVIDTPPLTAVSDAFPLLTKVDGVVIVGRVGHSRRDAAEQLQQVLSSSGAPLLGVIVNGAKSGSPIPYPVGGGSSRAVVSDDGASSSERLAPTAGA